MSVTITYHTITEQRSPVQSLFVHKHQIKRNRRHAGFTLVEMLAVAPIVLIVIGVLISAMVSMIGDALVANARTVVAYNTRDALNRIEDARISINFMSTFSLISAPQGKDSGTSAFNSGNDDLIMTNRRPLTIHTTTHATSFITPTSHTPVAVEKLVTAFSKPRNLLYKSW